MATLDEEDSIAFVYCVTDKKNRPTIRCLFHGTRTHDSRVRDFSRKKWYDGYPQGRQLMSAIQLLQQLQWAFGKHKIQKKCLMQMQPNVTKRSPSTKHFGPVDILAELCQ